MGNRAGAFCGGSVCPKAGQGGDNEIFDDSNTCDPAGAVFQETLEDLNEVDRLLLTFASSSNLVVVRWVFRLGANFDACDTNGTTALHAACRSGSLAVVRELIRRDLPLNATDVAGWTPLHVAFFMGRRSVAVWLMQSGADLAPRNLKGLAPSDLCSDVWLREAIGSCAAHRRTRGAELPWSFGDGCELGEDIKVSARLRFEPFFVPRAAVMKEQCKTSALMDLGVEIFNQRPGQGLAFLVATGAVRDFPVELSSFLLENRVSPVQVGEFLGENFSLSQTLRLEYINSVRMTGTGVVSCLAKVFKGFHLPSDLHKIDRLVDGIAQIWWRQHEQLKELRMTSDYACDEDDGGEVEGLSLMANLVAYDVLHQLMLSTILLHWNLYTPLPPSERVTPTQWLEMNDDLADTNRGDVNDAGGKMMKHIQIMIYNSISHSFLPQLQIWSNRNVGGGNPPTREATLEVRPEAEVSAADGEIEGWALVVGGNLPTLAGSSGTVTYRHIRTILSEATSTTLSLASPVTSRSSRPCVEPQAPDHDAVGAGLLPSVTYRHPGFATAGQVSSLADSSGQDRVWLSLRHGLLFLAGKPSNWAPYAFIPLKEIIVQSVNQASLVLTLAMGRHPEANSGSNGGSDRKPQATANSSGANSGEGQAQEPEVPQLQLIFLLPDGRWQVLDTPQMQIQLSDPLQLGLWIQSLEEYCSEAPPGLGSLPGVREEVDHEDTTAI
uniref:SEC7 domain-containing protein n=1 Tax=Pyrodinium bahamense TaxID=73915 RepID=A0A7S0A3L4_9DINO